MQPTRARQWHWQVARWGQLWLSPGQGIRPAWKGKSQANQDPASLSVVLAIFCSQQLPPSTLQPPALRLTRPRRHSFSHLTPRDITAISAFATSYIARNARQSFEKPHPSLFCRPICLSFDLLERPQPHANESHIFSITIIQPDTVYTSQKNSHKKRRAYRR